MKTSSFKSYALGLILAAAFAAFMLLGTLSGSNFPRGVKSAPPVSNSTAWSQFPALNQNLVFDYRSTWWHYNNTTLAQYLSLLDQYDLRTILMHSNYDPLDTNHTYFSDSLPYLVEHYSWGQANHLEVEWDLDEALRMLNEMDGTGYYYFERSAGLGNPVLLNGATVLKHYPNTTASKFVEGIKESQWPNERVHEPVYNYPNRPGYLDFYPKVGRRFRFRYCVGIDTSGYDVSPNDQVLVFEALLHFNMADSFRHCYDTLKVSDFDSINALRQFWIETALDTTAHDRAYDRTDYKFYTLNQVILYVDWVEYMDMEQAYPLVWSESLRDSTLADIKAEARGLLGLTNGHTIAGFHQTNEPHRPSYWCSGLVNDMFAADDSLAGHWPEAALNVKPEKRPDHYFFVGKPRIFSVSNYWFKEASISPGVQNELDSLAYDLDWVYDVCGDSIPIHYTAQLHNHTGAEWPLRQPSPAEIKAEIYLALAHGVKGINVYPYRSANISGTTTITDTGLVNLSYSHSAEPFASKWNTVSEIFAQIDSLGGTLLNLTRVGAYCAKDANGYYLDNYLESVHFEPENFSTAWIEVGQFHDAAENDYLILVNRHTEYPGHITIETNLSGDYALEDLYTKQKFISSYGKFENLPFDAGEGRVFKFSEFVLEEVAGVKGWPCGTTQVLTDTFLIAAADSVLISNETSISATKGAKLLVNGALVCGSAVNSGGVLFQNLEDGVNNRWYGIEISNLGNGTTTLNKTTIQGATYGLRIDDSGPVTVHDCAIEDSCYIGIYCSGTDLECWDTYVGFCSAFGAYLLDCEAGLYNSEADTMTFFGDQYGLCLVNSDPEIGRCGFSSNGDGLYCNQHSDPIACYSQNHHPHAGHNTFFYNDGDGVHAANSSYPILGTRNDWGYNSFIGNGGYAVNNYSQADTIFAQRNYWGGDPADSMFNGRVAYRPFLTEEPDNFSGGAFAEAKNGEAGVCGGGNVSPSNLNAIALELYLEQNYEAALDSFGLVVANFAANPAAQYALCFIDNCYRKLEDYSGAIAYLANCGISFAGNPLSAQAQLKSIYHLKKAGLGQQAYNTATNAALLAQLPQPDQEYAMIESGIIKKYYLCSRNSADSLFAQFLNLYPPAIWLPSPRWNWDRIPAGAELRGGAWNRW